MGANCEYNRRGFTLIELSIVLVIIGLIVGGILVGQNLISAAGVRAQVTQIEKYNTAANTFREKYGYLPGDIPDPAASSFGFQARGSCPGQGDGNGMIEGATFGLCTARPAAQGMGEAVMFWVDLSTAHLIDGGFTTAKTSATNATYPMTVSSNPSFGAFLPAAKIGHGNYIYVYSGTMWNGAASVTTGLNYYGLSAMTQIANGGNSVTSIPGLTVAEASAIDSKVDDGLPQTGRVTAAYIGGGMASWTSGLAYNLGAGYEIPLTTTTAQAGSASTCWDNGNTSGAVQQYSVEISNGANVTCALSFQMQAGD